MAIKGSGLVVAEPLAGLEQLELRPISSSGAARHPHREAEDSDAAHGLIEKEIPFSESS